MTRRLVVLMHYKSHSLDRRRAHRRGPRRDHELYTVSAEGIVVVGKGQTVVV